VLVGIKRIYDKASITDGKRVFVDRLWPRGVKKSTANVDLWMKDIAPSNELRLWFDHDPKKWESFKARYVKELESNKHVSDLIKLAEKGDVTLLYAAKDTEHNNAVVLSEYMEANMEESAE
jgi:uncharacterized protein YeaO (DUF488 family)